MLRPNRMSMPSYTPLYTSIHSEPYLYNKKDHIQCQFFPYPTTRYTSQKIILLFYNLLQSH